MSFYYPDHLYWLMILPLIAIIYMVRVYRRQKKIQKWSHFRKDLLKSSISEKKRTLKMGLEIFILALLFIALARPQSPGKKIEIHNKGIQLLLLIDVSKSMLAEDVKPSRLSFAKKKISQLIDLSSGDQIALGIFANSLILLTPFTSDVSAIKSYLNDLSTDYLSNQGTHFGKVFQSSDKIFADITDKKWEESVKAIVIVSDGEDHSKASELAAKKLFNEKGVRVFTLSVGTKEGGVIPIRDYRNQIKGYKKNSKGELVITRLKKDSLKKFAEKGKGSYYHLTYGGQDIKKLRKDLDLLEKTFLEKKSYIQKQENYQWILLLVFLVALTELILNDRSPISSFKEKIKL